MEHQPIGHDLEHRLHSENHQKYILHLLLGAEWEIQELFGLGIDGDRGRGKGRSQDRGLGRGESSGSERGGPGWKA